MFVQFVPSMLMAYCSDAHPCHPVATIHFSLSKTWIVYPSSWTMEIVTKILCHNLRINLNIQTLLGCSCHWQLSAEYLANDTDQAQLFPWHCHWMSGLDGAAHDGVCAVIGVSIVTLLIGVPLF
jgi:hypothetical protein